jgi:hypothetical protein
MPNAIAAVPSMRVSRARDRRGVARTILFKVDHARPIDQYIDYFGLPSAERARAPWADTLLEGLLARKPA